MRTAIPQGTAAHLGQHLDPAREQQSIVWREGLVGE